MRSTGVIYGECVGGEAQALVAISRLVAGGCEVRPLGHGAKLPGGELDLWIGAIGPLPIIGLRRRVGGGLAARFRQPLDDAILAHFAS